MNEEKIIKILEKRGGDFEYIKENMATKKDLGEMATKKDLGEMATKKDLGEMATKKDLVAFATKKDLEEMATKKDLMAFATKKDFAEMETQVDFLAQTAQEHTGRFDQIDGRIDKLTMTVIGHEERLDRIEENMATKKDIRGITATLDKIVTIVQKSDQEVTILAHHQRLMQKDIERIKPLVGLA